MTPPPPPQRVVYPRAVSMDDSRKAMELLEGAVWQLRDNRRLLEEAEARYMYGLERLGAGLEVDLESDHRKVVLAKANVRTAQALVDDLDGRMVLN